MTMVKHQGLILWLTGLSGAGKSTISKGLEAELKQRGCAVEVLDGDIIRTNLSKGLGFSREDRDTNIYRIGFVANLLSRNGVITIVSAISPYRETREVLKQTTHNFVEVYVKASLEICEARDVKGLYAKARSGELKSFTGIDDPYEEPLHPDIVCHTAEESIEQSVAIITHQLEALDYLSPAAQLTSRDRS
jgi:adenylylsulfate kinase